MPARRPAADGWRPARRACCRCEVLACPPGVEHAVEVLTLTARHGWEPTAGHGWMSTSIVQRVQVAQPRGDVARNHLSNLRWFPGLASRSQLALWLASSSGPGLLLCLVA